MATGVDPLPVEGFEVIASSTDTFVSQRWARGLLLGMAALLVLTIVHDIRRTTTTIT